MHVHVAVDDPEKAIQVMNGLLVHLPQMLALSSSSPFWRGEPTGLSSSRQMVFAAFPRSGPPRRFKDYADFADVVGQLERTGCIADYTHIWWDIRPHPRLGTSRDARLRRGHAPRGRRRDHGLLPGDREDVLRAARGRQGDPDLAPDAHDREPLGSPSATASRPRSWTSRRAAGTACRWRS